MHKLEPCDLSYWLHLVFERWFTFDDTNLKALFLRLLITSIWIASSNGASSNINWKSSFQLGFRVFFNTYHQKINSRIPTSNLKKLKIATTLNSPSFYVFLLWKWLKQKDYYGAFHQDLLPRSLSPQATPLYSHMNSQVF